MPTKNFYNFRYKFKPGSVDDSQTGVLEPKTGSESGFRLEHPSNQPDEKFVFAATEDPAQNWECVVVYDEETGVYTLEVLDSSLDIQHPERVNSKPTKTSNGDDSELLENVHYEEEEVEDDLEQAIIEAANPPIEPSPPPPEPPQPKPKKSKKAATETKVIKPQPHPKSPAKGKGKSDSAFKLALPPRAGPSTPHKETMVSQPAPPPVALALPTSAPMVLNEGFSDEDDLEPVDTLEEADQGQDADDDALVQELEDLMDEDEDMYKVEDPPTTNSTGPLSLNQYAGGQYSDDSSSSDDSEG